MAEDSRVVKTKKAIKEGFLALLGKKNIDTITVKDIALEANVDRKTVYNYYPGVYALIDEVEDDFKKTLEENTEMFQKINILETPQLFFNAVSDDIIVKLRRYKHFLNAQTNSNILLRLTKFIEQNVEKHMIGNLKHYCKNPNDYNVKLFATFITDGTIACCRNSFDRLEANPNRFVKDVTVLGIYGAMGLIKGIPNIQKNVDK